jgi:fructoselysine-6-P-deglycase FrlB-like protein
MRLWQGPVTLGAGLASAFGLSRIVKAEMSGKRLHRTHTNAGIHGPVEIPPNMLCVLLMDARAEGPQYEAEVLFTGQDYRLHLWKMGAGDTREPQVIDIGVPQPIVQPVAEPDILRYLDPEYSAALLEESLADEPRAK